MKNTIDRLAHLSGLRDREKLDFALVLLLREVVGDAHCSARLIRLAGVRSETRWQVAASLAAGAQEPLRERAWVDWESLPRLSDFPALQSCMAGGSVKRWGDSPAQILFPIHFNAQTNALVELNTSHPLTSENEHVVAGILKIFSNVQGLLDYGEKDALTDLLNRKTFDAAFLNVSMQTVDPELLSHPERRSEVGGTYWLAVLDIDHFKRVNDTYGHLVGDEVLLLFARLMRSTFRQHDQLYRFGGEEFVVLMRCATSLDANAAAERFRAGVASHVFPQVGSITVSIGYTRLSADDTPGSGFDRADKAVYYAKGNGRNQVQSYSALVESGAIVEEVIGNQETDFF